MVTAARTRNENYRFDYKITTLLHINMNELIRKLLEFLRLLI